MEHFEVVVDDGSEKEGEELGDEEAADDAEAEGDAVLGHGAADAEGDGDGSHARGKGRHKNGAEADEGSFNDGIIGRFLFFSNGDVGEVDHHNAVFHDDSNEENEADERIDGEGLIEDVKGEEAAEEGRGKGAHYSEGMDEALIENAQHDIDDEKGEDHEESEAGERLLKDISSSDEPSIDLGRFVNGEGVEGI